MTRRGPLVAAVTVWALLSASAGAESASLLTRPTSHLLTRQTRAIEQLRRSGRIAEAAATIIRTAGIAWGDDVIVPADDGYAPIRGWLARLIRRDARLAAAIAPAAMQRLRRLQREPLTEQAIGDADLWAAAVERSAPGQAALRALTARLRDAGMTEAAGVMQSRWLDEPPPPPNADRELVAQPPWPQRVMWDSPLDADGAIAMPDLMIRGARPRLVTEPILHDGRLYVRHHAALLCLDPRTLATIWDVSLDPSRSRREWDERLGEALVESAFGTPVVATLGGRPTVFVVAAAETAGGRGSEGHSQRRLTALAAFDAVTGDPLWRLERDGEIVLSPGVVVGGSLWTTLHDGRGLNAVRLDSGGAVTASVRLSEPSQIGLVPERYRQRPAMRLHRGRLLIAASEGGLAAIDPVAGRLDWVMALPSEAASRPQRPPSPFLVPRRPTPRPTLLPLGERVLAAAPDWSEWVTLDPATGRVAERGPLDEIVDLLPLGAAEAVAVGTDRLRILPGGEGILLPFPVREGAAIDGRRIALPTPRGVEVVSLDSPPLAGSYRPPLSLTADRAAAPRSLRLEGDWLFVQTLVGVERRRVGGSTDAASYAGRAAAAVSGLLDAAKRWLPLYEDLGDRIVATRPLVSRPEPPPAPAAEPWPFGEPTLTQQTQRRQVRRLDPIPLEASADAEPSNLNVLLGAFGRAVFVSGAAIEEATIALPSERSSRRGSWLLRRAWHRGRHVVVRIGSQVLCLRLRFDEESGHWRVEPAWGDRGGRPRLIDGSPVASFLDTELVDARGPLGEPERRNGLGEPLGELIVVGDLVVMRQSASLLAIEIASGRVRWRRLGLRPRDRIVACDTDDAIAIVNGATATLLDPADGSERERIATDLASDPEAIGVGSFLSIAGGEGRVLVPRQVDASDTRWSHPLPAKATAGSSPREAAIYDSASDRLRLIDRDGTVWFDEAIGLRESLAVDDASLAVVVGSAPDHVAVAIGADRTADSDPNQRPYWAPQVEGTLLVIGRRAGAIRYRDDRFDSGLPRVQPRDVPIVVTMGSGQRGGNALSNQSRLSLIGTHRRGPDEPRRPLLSLSLSGSPVFEIRADRAAEELLVKMIRRDYVVRWPNASDE